MENSYDEMAVCSTLLQWNSLLVSTGADVFSVGLHKIDSPVPIPWVGTTAMFSRFEDGDRDSTGIFVVREAQDVARKKLHYWCFWCASIGKARELFPLGWEGWIGNKVFLFACFSSTWDADEHGILLVLGR